MPRADQTGQAEPPGATSFDHPRDLSHEENLAAALSSFLSQLNSSLEAPRLDETVDVTDSARTTERGAAPSPAGQSFLPIARSQGLKRVLPSGALESSLYASPAHPAPRPPGAVGGAAGALAPKPVTTSTPGPATTQYPGPVAAQGLGPVAAQGPARSPSRHPARAPLSLRPRSWPRKRARSPPRRRPPWWRRRRAGHRPSSRARASSRTPGRPCTLAGFGAGTGPGEPQQAGAGS